MVQPRAPAHRVCVYDVFGALSQRAVQRDDVRTLEKLVQADVPEKYRAQHASSQGLRWSTLSKEENKAEWEREREQELNEKHHQQESTEKVNNKLVVGHNRGGGAAVNNPKEGAQACVHVGVG
eukprot:6195441-Pleurochrysis_carterae.AAC.1